MATTPTLGYGKTGSVDLDTFNKWFRAQPQYYAKLAEMGQDPADVHLNDDQKQQMVQLAQSMGAVINEGGSGQEVDDSGNFRNKSHKLKTGLIIAGLAAAALATAGAAGAFGGAALAGDAGAEAAAATGAEVGTDAALAGGAAEAAGGAAAATGAEAGLVGAEGVVEGTGVAGLTGTAAATAGEDAVASAIAEGGTVAADGSVWDASGNFVGTATDTTGSTIAGGGLPGSASSLLGGGTTAAKIMSLIGAGAKGIGAATTAAGNNRLTQQNAGLTANAQNINGQSAFEAELMARAKEEATQRTTANKDVYRNSITQNPRVSPFDPVGAPVYSDQYKATEANLGAQGAAKLANPAAYDTTKMAPLAPYTPIPINNVQGATGTAPGTAEKIGNIASPVMSVIGSLAKQPTTAELIQQLWGN